MASEGNSRWRLHAPLDDLPRVDFAFAYGSGVFQQPGHSGLDTKETPMIDYILGVQEPILWHTENIDRNRHHYNSWIAHFGGKALSSLAENIGAGVHFNAFVPYEEKMIKYGVVSMDNLVQDILTWRSLYISGRLQKPVFVLVDNWDIAKVNQVNLHAAISTAMLLLPSEFSEEDFYTKVCSLSYMGDVRMRFAEDKNKVLKIIRGSADKFHSLYRIPLCHFAAMGLLELPRMFGSPNSRLVKNCSPDAVNSLMSSLPTAVLQRVGPIATTGNNAYRGGEVAKAIQRAVNSIVRTSSTKQALSGLFAAGGMNSVCYVWKKFSKAWW